MGGGLEPLVPGGVDLFRRKVWVSEFRPKVVGILEARGTHSLSENPDLMVTFRVRSEFWPTEIGSRFRQRDVSI